MILPDSPDTGTKEQATKSASMASCVQLLPPECQGDEHFLTSVETEERGEIVCCSCGSEIDEIGGNKYEAAHAAAEETKGE